jgi:hypothetical protein
VVRNGCAHRRLLLRPESVRITAACVALRTPSRDGKVVRHFQLVLQKKDSIPVLSSQKLPELPMESKRNFCGGLYHANFVLFHTVWGVASWPRAR